MSHLFTVNEVCKKLGLDEEQVHTFVREEWIIPAGCEFLDDHVQKAHEPHQHYLDDADLARVRLIIELRNQFGVNDEGIPVILHLIDQIHTLRQKMFELQQLSSPPGGHPHA